MKKLFFTLLLALTVTVTLQAQNFMFSAYHAKTTVDDVVKADGAVHSFIALSGSEVRLLVEGGTLNYFEVQDVFLYENSYWYILGYDEAGDYKLVAVYSEALDRISLYDVSRNVLIELSSLVREDE